jgi:hypothetical protein
LQELEKLEEQLAETKLEIEKYKGQGQSHDTARKKILLELEEKLNKTEEREAQYEVKYQRTMKAIGHIKQVVGSTFNKIGGQHRRDATPVRSTLLFQCEGLRVPEFPCLEFVFETGDGSSLELCQLAEKRFAGDQFLILYFKSRSGHPHTEAQSWVTVSARQGALLEKALHVSLSGRAPLLGIRQDLVRLMINSAS